MSELTFFHYLVTAWFILASIIFVALFFIIAPYGRHSTGQRRLTLGSATGWIVMESIAPIIFAIFFLLGQHPYSIPELIFLGLWEAHYIHRAYIYPLHRRDNGRPMPVAIISLGFVFNSINAYINSRYLYTFSGGYSNAWLADPRFVAGAAIFIIGFILNRESDLILRTLRQPGESGYRIAYQGFYRWISCPNYLGEILIWTGWALATWSLAGLSFAFWTAANLIPRARSHHLWYKKNFSEYPPNRHALIPGIW